MFSASRVCHALDHEGEEVAGRGNLDGERKLMEGLGAESKSRALCGNTSPGLM